jgi:hypothetical protein
MSNYSRQPKLNISFDKDNVHLYHLVRQQSSATHIKASGLVRMILTEYYDNRKTVECREAIGIT